LGRYVFFADLAGRADDEPVVEALAAVGRSVETLRVLGCYPSA
jgi:prephenate dehydratase